MKIQHAVLSFGLLAAAMSPVVIAQTATTATTATTTTTDTKQPTAIGVSQEKANVANQKAVQSGQAATLVRTGPSAADKAGEMTDKAKHTAKDVKHKTKAKVDSTTTATQ